MVLNAFQSPQGAGQELGGLNGGLEGGNYPALGDDVRYGNLMVLALQSTKCLVFTLRVPINPRI